MTNDDQLTRGTRVRIQRDETRYPSKGTWPQFRGRTGTIVDINPVGPGPNEYGVTFSKSPRAEYWFKAYELTPLKTGPSGTVTHRTPQRQPAAHTERVATISTPSTDTKLEPSI